MTIPGFSGAVFEKTWSAIVAPPKAVNAAAAPQLAILAPRGARPRCLLCVLEGFFRFRILVVVLSGLKGDLVSRASSDI